MKIAKRRLTTPIKKQPVMVCKDEFHTFAAPGSSQGAVLGVGHMMFRPDQRRMIATQAIMRFNSGKRVRFIGCTRYEDTGDLTTQAPRKFVPAQVERKRGQTN